MDKLFDIDSVPKKHREERCKECEHFTVLEYDTGKRIFYCSLHKSNRTLNGLQKIKANQESCDAFKKSD